MGKRLLKYLFTMFMICIGSFLLTACFSPKQFVVSVKFIGKDSELTSINSYQRGVEYGKAHEVTFKIPEGYDSSSITAKLVVGTKSAELPVEIKYKDSLLSAYRYATDKEVTVKLEGITANCSIEIDMSGVERKVCSLDMTDNTNFGKFTAVAINPSELSQLIVLDTTKVLKTYEQTAEGKLEIDYGDYIALIYNKDYTMPEYETIYSRDNYFTESSHKANVGKIHYSFYNKSVRGNVAYNYHNGTSTWSNTRIFYLGEVREDMSFYDSIPDYVESKGFSDIEEIPNTLAFLTNMSKYSSSLMTTTIYKKSTKLYNPSDSSLDMISSTGTVIEKVSGLEEKYNRYDLYRLYIGDNYSAETHWTAEEKADILEEAYLCIESEIALSYFENLLLEYENQPYIGAFEFDLDLTASSGKKYVKLSRELLETFLLDRSYEDDTISYDYQTGMAILYVKPTLELDKITETVEVINGSTGVTTRVNRKVYTEISTIYKFKKSDTTPEQSIYDYETAVYVIRDGKKDFGLIDYHYRYNIDKNPMVYIKTEYILNNNNDYNDSLYVDIVGPEVVNHKSPRIGSVDIKCSGEPVFKNDKAIFVEEGSEINGIRNQVVGNSEFVEGNDSYAFRFTISLSNNRTEAYQVDFTNMELPKVSSQGVYVSNDVDFDELTDFTLVNYLTAAKTSDDVSDKMKLVNFGYFRDIYFIVVSDVEFSFNIYLDPSDPTSRVSITRPLYDIVGNPLTIEVGGEDREVRVMYLDVIYDIYKTTGDYRFFAG